MTENHFLKQREEFFFLVGSAVTQWASIERALLDFCKFALATTYRKAAIVFYRSPSISEHLNLTDELMCASELDHQQMAHWEAIARVTRRLLPFRNDIAHNPASSFAFEEMGPDPKDPAKSYVHRENWFAITAEPSKLLTKRGKAREVNATAERLKEHVEHLKKLEEAMGALKWELTGTPLLGESTALPTTFPNDLEQILDRIESNKELNSRGHVDKNLSH